MPEHMKLSLAIHEEAPLWTAAMARISDERVREYLETFSTRTDADIPRIRVWMRIVTREAHRRGISYPV